MKSVKFGRKRCLNIFELWLGWPLEVNEGVSWESILEAGLIDESGF